MRVLRMSFFALPGEPPVTTVARDRDLRLSIEETVKELMEAGAEIPIEKHAEYESSLFLYEVFDMKNADIAEATEEAIKRLSKRADVERNMAVLYFYNADALRIIQEGGYLINPARAPLDADDIEEPLRQLVRHPNYRSQSVITTSHDGIEVTMKDGGVTRRRVTPPQG